MRMANCLRYCKLDKVAMISLPIFAGLLKFISVYINESLAKFVQKWNESVKQKIKIDLRSIKVTRF